MRYGFRTLDRQWIYADARMMNDPRPELWANYSNFQVFLTSPEDQTPENGPPLSLTSHIPDQHHYHGRGGRVLPLWRDAAATIPNIKSALIAEILEDRHGRASTVVTSQLPVEHWHEAIGDPTLADAILDRVRAFLRTSGSHALTSQRPQAQTYRRKHAKSRRPQRKP